MDWLNFAIFHSCGTIFNNKVLTSANKLVFLQLNVALRPLERHIGYGFDYTSKPIILTVSDWLWKRIYIMLALYK